MSGYGDEIVTITLNVFCPQVGPNGELRGQAATTAYLKCSVHGAVNLREAINNALARAQRPPETTAQATKVRNVRTTISDKAVPCPLNHVNRAVPCAKAECPLGLGHQCAAASGVRDGGWPPAIGLQERVANHRKRRWSKAGVVSVTEKALQRRQVGDRKANTREPPFKCRKCSDDVETGE